MMGRLQHNQEPLPTWEEINQWTEQLVEAAGACATTVEREVLRDEVLGFTFAESVVWHQKVPDENYERFEAIYAKLRRVKMIKHRIQREETYGR